MTLMFPDEVLYIIEALEHGGHEAYAVGGCVRDSLLGAMPKDWDICTSALPEQTMKCFEQHRIIETGRQHGTLTIMINQQPFEVTTFRIDGTYTDHRHPDRVAFTSCLKDDLSRRDFTVNALAYHPQKGIIDYWGGVADLNAGIIRCVGEAGKRFQEDALRIMRALRFAATLGFSIDKKTVSAMIAHKALLMNIAAERIASELNQLLIGADVCRVLSEFSPLISSIIPEIAEGYCLRVSCLSSSPRNLPIRLAILLKDSETAKNVLERLKYDKKTTAETKRLIRYSGDPRRLNFTRKDLTVNGNDLIAAGVPEGADVGRILNYLLDMVIDEAVRNDKADLMKVVKAIRSISY